MDSFSRWLWCGSSFCSVKCFHKCVHHTCSRVQPNKHNRAHYDQDNPPPKVVQGYKFNIFYPDLIDKSKAPTYKILPDPSGDDSTVILQFCAGAPYEDIAFRIVNKEWDRGPKKGFKNVFDRCMLQLYFSFKRTPYKR